MDFHILSRKCNFFASFGYPDLCTYHKHSLSVNHKHVTMAYRSILLLQAENGFDWLIIYSDIGTYYNHGTSNIKYGMFCMFFYLFIRCLWCMHLCPNIEHDVQPWFIEHRLCHIYILSITCLAYPNISCLAYQAILILLWVRKCSRMKWCLVQDSHLRL